MHLRLTSILLLTITASIAQADELTPEQVSFFEAKIRPVLIRECYGCHSNKSGNVRGGLRLDTQELTHIGGSSGPAIVPGNLEESWLYNAITHQDYVMPPKRKLPQNVIDDFRKWIEMGAPDPRVTVIEDINSSITQADIEHARNSFWAYQPPTNPPRPAVKNAAWPQRAIDHHVLAKLEASKLEPAQDAAAWKVLRRLTFDLVGLPSTPEDVESFAIAWQRDPDQAVADVVDRLLQTEQFGERWGRHWLDVVRYAESTGREVNMTYPQAWRYRDYVIDSFNDDKPFDRFVQEQLAGDLLPVKTDEQWSENLVATTFLAIGARNINEQNPVQFAADVADEQIDATTRVFLGMSVACARCHDHKFDAIPQTDYYALAGIFRNMTTYFGNPQSEFGSFSGAQAKQNSSLLLLPVDDPNPFDKRYTKQEYASLEGEIEDMLAELRSNRGRSADGNRSADAARNRLRLLNQMQTLSGKLAAIDEDGNPKSYCMGVQERGEPQNAKLLVRGEIDQSAQEVARGFPQVLSSTPVTIPGKSSGRRELARWIGSDANPLAARVMVNRIWHHMMGQGIVTSMENFGTTGQPPSHPELLDHLAVRFVESGWSVKTIVREIATSRAYRMDSTFNQDHHERDPDNTFLWRANPRRLDAEAIRDAMLSISGEIDFDRPRASEVAKAGYVRVQGGQLGPARGGMSSGRSRDRTQPGERQRPLERGALRQRPGGRIQGMPRGPMGGRGRRSGSTGTNSLDMESARYRSVYLPIVRDEEPRSLEVFDFADSSAIIGQRESSNTANQALYMMNNGFVIQQSDAFAERVSQKHNRAADQVEYAFRLAYGRPPTSGERSATLAFVSSFSSTSGIRGRSSTTLAALCQSLFASAEFRYVD